MKTSLKFPLVAMLAIFASCENNTKKAGSEQTGISPSNPFLKESTLPYQVADFEAIKDGDFEPAILEGMKIQLNEIGRISENKEAPTFENTLVELEKSGLMLKRVNRIFNLLSSANTNEDLKQIKENIAAKQAAHKDAIFLNAKLFKRIEALYNERSKLKLDAESKKLIEYYYEKFILSGARLSDQAKSSLKILNEEEASLSAKFSNQLLNASKSGALVVDMIAELNGLSEAEIKTAAEAAKLANQEGKWQLSLQNTTQQSALQNLSDRDTRKKLFEASWNRTQKGDTNDTRSTILKIAKIRAEKAELMGFANYAEWKLQDQMAKTPAAVEAFFAELIPSITNRAKAEAAEIQSLIDKQKGGFKLEAYDWNYYAEQVRKAKYDLNENEIKPYFEVNNVLKNGVFYAATQLYGITFKERTDLPVYHKDVKVFELFNEDKTPIGLFYYDFFKRDNKSGGAWMSNMVEQSKLLGTKPVIFNVCNYTKPTEGEPALISFDDVTTMFHEFGHALHGFFADQQYPSLSGTSVARDYVEFPSQFNEHWASDPAVFKNYAIHHSTGQPMPQQLVDKLKKAADFNQGYALAEVIAAAALDMQWHKLSAKTQPQDADKFETEALKKAGLNLSYIPPRYRSTYFLHIWANGYAAGYYAYLWAEMLDHDAFSWFQENGGLTRANGQRFREMILSRGNTGDYGKMFRDFRGQDANLKAMKRYRGLPND